MCAALSTGRLPSGSLFEADSVSVLAAAAELSEKSHVIGPHSAEPPAGAQRKEKNTSETALCL